MSANPPGDDDSLPLAVERRIDEVCDRFEAAWKAGQRPRIAAYLQGAGEPERSALLRELLFLDLVYRDRAGQRPTREEYHGCFSTDVALIDSVFDQMAAVNDALDPTRQTAGDSRLALGIDASIGSHPSSQLPLDAPPHERQEAGRTGPLGAAAVPISLEQFVQWLAESSLMTADGIDTFLDRLPEGQKPETAEALAKLLCRRKKLTRFQAQAVYLGKTKGLVLGNYVVLDKIGAGGMGHVYQALHRRMRRTVALKVLPAAVTSSKEAVQRFQREVEAAAKLEHPNIVTALDADEADGVHFLVMQYVEGEDLSVLVQRSGTLQVGQALDYVIQAAQGLHYAHAKGVIHRDVKPSNLLLDAEGTVKILDMGLARSRQGAGPDALKAASLTGSGQVLGTVDYMSPEQSLDSQHADQRSDVYSLGCTLFYLLTGQPVYAGSTVTERILARHEQPLPSLCDVRRDVPPQLDEVFQKMVAKQADDRYQSMDDVIADLEACRAAVAQQAADSRSSVAELDSGGDTGNRRRIVFGSIAAGLLFLALAVVGVMISMKTPGGLSLVTVDRPEIEPAKPRDVTPFVQRQSGEPPVAVAPFTPEEAKRHQERWAQYLTVSVVETNSIGMQLALIPPGEFLMGSVDEEIAKLLKEVEQAGRLSEKQMRRIPSEGPQHQVRITEPFYFCVHEVTVGQFEAFVQATGYRTVAEIEGWAEAGRRPGLNWRNPGRGQTDRHPVTQLCWSDAVVFCQWLSRNEGKTYRLPTEAEWEYACRAGSITRWYFGDDAKELDKHAWYKNNAFSGMRPVGQKPPNAFGLYDMYGNARECCSDWSAEDYYRLSPVDDPEGPSSGDFRAFRGGAFYYCPEDIRSTFRIRLSPDYRSIGIGFRPVRTCP